MTWAAVVTLVVFGLAAVNNGRRPESRADLFLCLLIGAWCFACAAALWLKYL